MTYEDILSVLGSRRAVKWVDRGLIRITFDGRASEYGIWRWHLRFRTSFLDRCKVLGIGCIYRVYLIAELRIHRTLCHQIIGTKAKGSWEPACIKRSNAAWWELARRWLQEALIRFAITRAWPREEEGQSNHDTNDDQANGSESPRYGTLVCPETIQ